MAPTVPSEPSCSKKRLTRSRKLTDKEEHVAANSSNADKTPSVLDLFAKHVSKKKKMNVEMNEIGTSDPLHEEKRNGGLDLNVKVEFDKENHNPQVNQDQTEEQLEKRMKVEDKEKQQSISDIKVRDTLPIVSRCEYCKQKIDFDLKLYQGHPNGAVEEQIALTDPKLCLFTGDESFIHESDERPVNKLTYFR